MSQNRKRPAETDADEDSTSSKIACSSKHTETRDFLSEFKKVQSEADEVKNVLISKTAHLNSSIMNSGIFGEIMRELKTMRTEIKENQEKNDKKMEQMRKELKEELAAVRSEIVKITPIRQAILGQWKMVEHENFEKFMKVYTDSSLERFSSNLEFKLVDGKLVQTSAAYDDVIESEEETFVVEGDHLKSFWTKNGTDDYYIENGKLYYVEEADGHVWKRIYEKI